MYDVAECFNKYFCIITDSLDIDPLFKEVPEHMSVEQMVLRALTKYKDHPSIKVINQNVALNGNTFSLSHVSPNEVMKQMELFEKNKSNSGNIPTGMVKATREIVCPYLTDGINSAVYDCNFRMN